jgi:acyl carrier protein
VIRTTVPIRPTEGETAMFDELKEILVSKFQLDAADVGPRSTLKELELDSLDHVELSLVIEKELGVKVSDDELNDAQEIGRIVSIIESRNAKV